jgi:hypothetical protein
MEHFDKQGMQMECTVPYTPKQNGIAERLNRTIVDKARCMLLSSNLPKSFWTEAVTTATFLINGSPTVALENCTPAEKWFGFKPRLVIKGCSQKRGIDYDEVYTPVARLTTIRTLRSVILENNLHAMQMDVKNAFLHGKLKETIYLHESS